MFESQIVTVTCIDSIWLAKLRFSILRLFEQSAFANNNLLRSWPTVHSSILKICADFQMRSFLRSMSCTINNKQILCEVKIFQLQSLLNTKAWTNKRVEVKNSGISCRIFNLSNPRTTILHAQNKVARCNESYTIFFERSIRNHGSVLRRVAVSRVIWVPSRFPLGAATLCSPSAILRDAEPVSAQTHALLYCCCAAALSKSIFFFFLDFLSGDLELTRFNSWQ